MKTSELIKDLKDIGFTVSEDDVQILLEKAVHFWIIVR